MRKLAVASLFLILIQPAQAGGNLSFSAAVSLDKKLRNTFDRVSRKRQRGEYLNGYRIGRYPKPVLINGVLYKSPSSFIEVTPKNENTNVSPHFQLKQFLSKQEGSYPKYVVLQEKLLVLLELIVEKLKALNLNTTTLGILSGYRTPYYNKAIGNTPYSRHQYGDAADIYADENHDGTMDDLNRDGQIDIKDALYLANIVDQVRQENPGEFVGGLGIYKKTDAHGPFVHVDTRGFEARWQQDPFSPASPQDYFED